MNISINDFDPSGYWIRQTPNGFISYKELPTELTEQSLEKIRAIVREEIAKVLHPEPEISDYDESLD